MKMLMAMINLATEAHSEQFDKGGFPYILHPLAVRNICLLGGADEELQCIALGHDLIEDTYVTETALRNAGFSERVISGIRCMTKLPGESIEDYQSKVLSNIDACKCKMADLTHNSDLRRLKGVTDKDIARVGYYARFYDTISKHLNSLS